MAVSRFKEAMDKLGFMWVSKCGLGNISGFFVGF